MMAMLQIGKSGVMTARAALDTTAQNIANAGNEDYARRSVTVEEVATSGQIGRQGGSALAGVRVAEISRSTSIFLQSEARRSAADLARADAELVGLRNAETAVEQSGLYASIVDFEAALSRLATDPLGGALRNAVVEEARRVAQTFQVADNSLGIAEAEIRFETEGAATLVNVLAADLARTNTGIARALPGSSNMAVLLDQRDALLQDLTGLTGGASSFDSLGRAIVRLDGRELVAGSQAFAFTATEQADGSFAFAVDGAGVALASGTLLGRSQAGAAVNAARAGLDALASGFATLANDAQASGTARDGSPGAPMFSGSTAGTITMVLANGDALATAPAGAAAGSRDIGNLQALRDALANGGPAAQTDALLYGLSSAISTRSATRDALRTIADTAQTALSAETGVDLDQEAANLVRLQQAFEANGRVIQVAADIFDTLLGMGR
ncbi:flagellar hook-associated protein FlgK [Erythrobacter sp. EC-HK427]|uniref:flagellar hook-associated protein FlgK n=1 Tax=Erythrobacter sp. EC-HK427 TaxID=2038396 RepID=UPI001254CFD3|nr:flagellar hook-associated protein FlgK [Erythrobacter sp. EC-HK427]VVT01607.1 Flagellar hook-associated protein 1 FlgK [Erythrobacter sp. EC-HK427]